MSPGHDGYDNAGDGKGERGKVPERSPDEHADKRLGQHTGKHTDNLRGRNRLEDASPRGRRAGPVFLEREGYRQRRVIDAVRLLPVLGGALFLVPLLWGRGETASAAALHYIFGVWIVLIVLAGLLSRAVRRAGWRDPAAPDREPR